METIGLLAAMPQERDALLRYVQKSDRATLGPFRTHCFRLSGWHCLLITSGMGPRRAGEAARLLIEAHEPQLLVSFGIAGAVEADLQIGDVVMAEAVCRLDRGVLDPLFPLATWSSLAREAATRALSRRNARLFTGMAVTTQGSWGTKDQLGEMIHPVLEMETIGIAQVAASKGIPLLTLRAISDTPRASIPFNLVEIMGDDANLRTAMAIKAIMRQPGIVLQVGRLIHNARIAADNVALALVTALSQPALLS